MSYKMIEIPPGNGGQKLSDWLRASGYEIPLDCGGRGVCGKCKVRVAEGNFPSAEDPLKLLQPDENGDIRACRALCPDGSAKILLKDMGGQGLTEFTFVSEEADGKGVAAALDIGTTTVAAALVDRETGRILDTVSKLNPQRSYGADVISRIAAAKDGNLLNLQRQILCAASDMLTELSERNPQKKPECMAVTGNTTMLHLFCGISPEGIGTYPFTPAFTDLKELDGQKLSLPVERVILLPSASAFIGSDVIAGALVCRMRELSGPSALLDIGTNGEMIVCTGRGSGNKLYAASAAAGPAMEGANISCGTGGIDGAVCAVLAESFRTIQDKPPCGLCGCGLVDLIASLLDQGLLDETGSLTEDAYTLKGSHLSADGQMLSACSETPIVLTQQDIREFQLAKSAIRAGFEALLAEAGILTEQLEKVFIAGGLGYYMNIRSAVRTGLLPAEALPVIEAVGNSSLAGAAQCLSSSVAISEAGRLARECEIAELNSSALFNGLFIENMLFPEE